MFKLAVFLVLAFACGLHSETTEAPGTTGAGTTGAGGSTGAGGNETATTPAGVTGGNETTGGTTGAENLQTIGIGFQNETKGNKTEAAGAVVSAANATAGAAEGNATAGGAAGNATGEQDVKIIPEDESLQTYIAEVISATGGLPSFRGANASTENITAECTDTKRLCPYWKSRDWCTKGPEFMHRYCAGSCNNNCNAKWLRTTKCENEHENCKTWFDAGLCNIEPYYMVWKCTEICGFCTAPNSTFQFIQPGVPAGTPAGPAGTTGAAGATTEAPGAGGNATVAGVTEGGAGGNATSVAVTGGAGGNATTVALSGAAGGNATMGHNSTVPVFF